LNRDVIFMPDKWEYPWYAAWDLAFHWGPLAMIDPDFARSQLEVMLSQVYLYPSGQIPAYEWNFGDVNPPVHAFATLFIHSVTGYRGEVDLRSSAHVRSHKESDNRNALRPVPRVGCAGPPGVASDATASVGGVPFSAPVPTPWPQGTLAGTEVSPRYERRRGAPGREIRRFPGPLAVTLMTNGREPAPGGIPGCLFFGACRRSCRC
jgi:hypothetical protein